MNKKTSIIISITGITIIVLILLGFTYGYYLTKITGNDNSKSISVTIGEMSVTYTDLSVEALSAIIEPGYETVKLFTIENTGNVQGIYSIYLTDVVNEFVRTDDIQYTLYRKEGNNTIEDLSDCEIIATGTFPKENTYIKTNEVIENPGDFYTYALQITYINSTENQNEDQGHTFSGKVEIHAMPKSPYDEGTLANVIFNNAVKPTTEELASGYATFTVPTPTDITTEINGETESVLSSINDDNGVSYYYRGGVKNNYLEFNEMCWRIVRIEGDGAIKITLAAPKACSSITSDDTGTAFIGTGDYGYTENDSGQYIADYENSTGRTTSMKYKLNEWFTTNLSSVSNKLKTTQACIGDTTTQYDSNGIVLVDTSITTRFYNNYRKLILNKNASLVCETQDTKTAETQIYPLTVNEVVLAGGKIGENNTTYYLNNNATSNNWWTINPSYYNNSSDYIFDIGVDGIINYDVSNVLTSNGIRPVVSLISGTQFNGGNGSITNPYTIK